jgi:hypothetical protein
MHVNDYVEQVHDQIRATAALGDERTQQIAASLAGAVDASVRLALLAAVSAAAGEISAALLETNGGPAVTVAVDGDEIRIDVAQATTAPTEPPPDEGDATARISLRLSERLKADIEQTASRDGVSVNTWLVRAANAMLTGPAGPGGWPGPGGWGGPGWRPPGWGGHGRGTQRVTGWVIG